MARGAFSAAWEAVERYGFDALAAQLGAWDLLRLADLARLTGHPTHAREALLLLRAKYPDQPAASAAAFRLGRMEFDQDGDPRQAVHWFRLVVAEEPDGDLAPEARGRLMEALGRVGDQAGARRVAADYLRLHPDGAHAALARSLAAESH